MANQFQCCFCGEGIESGRFDVGSLLYTINFEKNEASQHDQQMFCHMECFKKTLHRSVKLYVLDLIDDDS